MNHREFGQWGKLYKKIIFNVDEQGGSLKSLTLVVKLFNTLLYLSTDPNFDDPCKL
jgi:hypothetical protein